MGGGKRRQGPPVLQSIVSQHHTSVLHIFVFNCQSVYILRAMRTWHMGHGARAWRWVPTYCIMGVCTAIVR